MVSVMCGLKKDSLLFAGKKAIIFNMDGTLIDSVGIWNQIDEALIARIRTDGGSGGEDVQLQRDMLLRRFAKEANPYVSYCAFLGKTYGCAMPAEEINALRNHIADDYLETVVDYKDGADSLVRALKVAGMRLCIGTTTRRRHMDIYRTKNRNIISKANIDDYFDLIYTQEDVREKKPNPEVFLRIMNELAVSPSECLVFEDSLVGIEAAVRAGIDAVAVYDRYSDGEREEINALATWRVDDYRVLIAAEFE
ncbi:MAG: HAD family phosphatase [Clostridiales bacterium]|nr:HAD family phosphatase [Clostridiales bacterium]